MSAEQPSISRTKGAVMTYVLLILAGSALIAAHILDDKIPAFGSGSGNPTFDITPPYSLLALWWLLLLLVFAASLAWTAPDDMDGGGGSRATFRLTGCVTFLASLLMAFGDWTAIAAPCAPGVSPVYGFVGGATCWPIDQAYWAQWVHWDRLQFPLHLGACVLLVTAFRCAALTWRLLRSHA
jgi:hypothetical protein